MMHGKLAGKRVVVTGVSRGVGREIVKLFTGEDAEVLGVARDAAKLKELQGSLSQPLFTWIQGDVTDKALAGRLAEEAGKRWGAVDMLINNAAIQQWNKGFHDEDVDLVEKDLLANVVGPHRLIHGLLPLLLKGREPRILNVSSGAGKFEVLQTSPDMPAYRLSKYALNGLSLLYAAELKGRVDVNSLDPGWLKTDMGGPQAPGKPEEGAQRALEVLCKPFGTTGKFWYGAEEIKF